MTSIPSDAKFIAFSKTSTYVPGDERSRTNPGHGYPAHTVENLEPVFFKTEEELVNWLQSPYRGTSEKENVFSVKKVEIKTEMKVIVK